MKESPEHGLHDALGELEQALEGELKWDRLTRMLYASDASLYQRLPLAVAYPRHAEDCVRVVNFARQHQLPVIPRAAGTSLGGQVVGEAIIVDVSRYLNHVLHLDPKKRTARVQPGVTLSQLNEASQKYGLHFAPDPSTLDRANIAGVIGNNAWGAHAPAFGTTREHIDRIELVVADGQQICVAPLNSDELAAKREGDGVEARIYREVLAQLAEKREQILARYPDPARVPSNTGYALHVLARRQPFVAGAGPFSLVPLLCGSEGTLGLITEVTVKLMPLPALRRLLGVQFATLRDAFAVVETAVNAGASAVELLDEYVLSLTRQNAEQRRNSEWVGTDARAVLLIEFFAEDLSDLQSRIDAFANTVRGSRGCLGVNAMEGEAAQRAWSMRRAGLGLLMGMPGNRKPTTFIEDCAVPVPRLSGFVDAVDAVMREENVDCVYYGSVSWGLIHLRPLLDLNNEVHRAKLPRIAARVAELVVANGGSFSAKHGDGIVRSGFVALQLGPEVLEAMRSIKRAFDPYSIFNPGKIVDNAPMQRHWRIQAAAPNANLRTGFDWRVDGGIRGAVQRCNGAAVCRKRSGGGMCPSFRVTLDEKNVTRGRANVYRQVLAQGQDGLADDDLHEVLEHCLQCKACRSECPANVDMARLKAEHLYQYYMRHGRPLRVWMVSLLDALNAVAARMPRVANHLASVGIFKQLLGFHPQRPLPTITEKTFSRRFREHSSQLTPSRGRIVVLNDLFTEYYDPQVGMAAVEVLQAAGYEVVVTECVPSLRTVISHGLLGQAQRRILNNIITLRGYLREAEAVIGLEPSELLTYRDEVQALTPPSLTAADVEAVTSRMFLFDEFVARNQDIFRAALKLQRDPFTVLVHGHCHQKALADFNETLIALSCVPGANVEAIPAGCCGMAGMFGYEAQHYEMSNMIGHKSLFPAIAKSSRDVVIVASGTSCRQQIIHNTQHEPIHPAQLLQSAI